MVVANPEIAGTFRDCHADLVAFFARQHPDADSAADLAAESMLQFLRKLSAGTRPGSMRAYLFGIARHVGDLAAGHTAALARRDVDRHGKGDPAVGPRIAAANRPGNGHGAAPGTLPEYASEEARHPVAAWIELMPEPPKSRSPIDADRPHRGDFRVATARWPSSVTTWVK